MNQEQERTLQDFLERFDGYTLSDLGPALTCSEAQSWVNLLNAFGYAGKAAALLSSHTAGDEYGDDHFQEQ